MLLKNQPMYLDMSAALRNLSYLERVHMPVKIKMGLRLAGMKLMQDTVTGLPTMPIRRAKQTETSPYGGERIPGGLRGSGALFVDGVKKATSVTHGIALYQPAAYGGTPILPMSHEACVVFNAPYALEQHEEWPSKTEPTAGMHYMSIKLYGNAVEYIAIVARALKL